VEQSHGMLKLFYLPPYSPRLNSDETVWAHVKRDVSRRLVENKEHMKQLALSFLYRLQKLPILIMSFFRHSECRPVYSGMTLLSEN
jgi:transposase